MVRYRRILLKLSGEALMGGQAFGIDPEVLQYIGAELEPVVQAGVQVGLVIGGGNIFRGISLAAGGMNRAAGDDMGMLATVINALALQEALERRGLAVRVMSALAVAGVCEPYSRREAVAHLEQGRVVIFAAGTGNPFFTTDTAATLRGIEVGAELVLKGTKVDGVYSADPVQDPEAVKYDRLTYDEVIERRLAVMDTTAIVMCRDHGMPLRVFDMNHQGALLDIVNGIEHGTLVTEAW